MTIWNFNNNEYHSYQGTGNREQGTENREQGTGNREQGTGNKTRKICFLGVDKEH
jgi:hypothetical protein